MGYRTKLGKIPKHMKDHFVGLNYKDAVKKAIQLTKESIPDYKEKYYIALEYELPNFVQLYELGKYANYEDGRIPFFSFDIYEECESEFDILTKEGLLKIIEDYHNKILKNFEDDFKIVEDSLKEFKDLDDDSEEITIKVSKEGYFELYNTLKSKVREWNRSYKILPYYLDQEHSDGMIVSSWKYEYAIFNLVYIYRTFDWENDYLIYSAW